MICRFFIFGKIFDDVLVNFKVLVRNALASFPGLCGLFVFFGELELVEGVGGGVE